MSGEPLYARTPLSSRTELASLRDLDGLACAATAEALWLRNLFKHEFYFSPRQEFRKEIRDELERIDTDWDVSVDGGEGSARALLSRATPLVAHATLLDFLYAYLVMARLLERADGEERSKGDWVAMALRYGRQAYLQRDISSDACIGRQILDNAYRWFEGEGLAPPSESRRGELRCTRERLEKTVRRAEQLGSLANVGRWELAP